MSSSLDTGGVRPATPLLPATACPTIFQDWISQPMLESGTLNIAVGTTHPPSSQNTERLVPFALLCRHSVQNSCGSRGKQGGEEDTHRAFGLQRTSRPPLPTNPHFE